MLHEQFLKVNKSPNSRVSYPASQVNIRILHPIKGKLFWSCEETSGIISGGEILFIPLGYSLSYYTSRSATVTELVFEFKWFYKLIKSVCPEEEIVSFTEKSAEYPGIKIFLPDRDLFEKCNRILNELERENTTGQGGSRSLCIAGMIQLFILLYRIDRLPMLEEKSPAEMWAIDDVVAYVENNYSETFTLEDLSGRCGLNPSYFSRAFKEKTGFNLFEHINHIRIQKACALLKKSELPIIEIAYAVGYNNLSFFNRYFKRIMKVSPREYRQLTAR
ncbi:MAG: helix-turn-helix transcriptional regulator [Spirochaetales bacterium]|nr:helix-turn-helix transcriptional regulator [Spirochaetales bacterium]